MKKYGVRLWVHTCCCSASSIVPTGRALPNLWDLPRLAKAHQTPQSWPRELAIDGLNRAVEVAQLDVSQAAEAIPVRGAQHRC